MSPYLFYSFNIFNVFFSSCLKISGAFSHIHTQSVIQYAESSLQFILDITFGPSGVRALPLAVGINEGGHYFGPSGVRALPLAAGTNEGGHYFHYIFYGI